jgi:hypothetical protein
MNHASLWTNGSQQYSCDDARQSALSHDGFRESLHSAANHDALRQPDRGGPTPGGNKDRVVEHKGLFSRRAVFQTYPLASSVI